MWNAAIATGANLAMEGNRRAYARAEARKQREWSSAEAATARDHSERMASTEIQRRAADMEAAGINPILAAGNVGGADVSSPMASGGATADTPAGGQLDPAAMSQAATQRKLVRAQVNDINSAAQLKTIDAQSRAVENITRIDEAISRIDKNIADTKLTDETRKNRQEERKNLIATRDQIYANIRLLNTSATLNSAKTILTDAQTTHEKEKTEKTHVERTLEEKKLPAAEVDAVLNKNKVIGTIFGLFRGGTNAILGRR